MNTISGVYHKKSTIVYFIIYKGQQTFYTGIFATCRNNKQSFIHTTSKRVSTTIVLNGSGGMQNSSRNHMVTDNQQCFMIFTKLYDLCQCWLANLSTPRFWPELPTRSDFLSSLRKIHTFY